MTTNRKPITVTSFRNGHGVTLFDRLVAQTALRVNVVPTPMGFTATDPTHLRFNATFRTEAEASAAAVLAMARRPNG